MRKTQLKKFSSLGLSALLLGGSFLPNLAVPVKAASFGNVVISEVYGGGGNSNAVYKNDFIELYNPTDQDINLDGWSVQYAASGAGKAFGGNTPLTGTIKAHGYYLIQEASGGANGEINPTPDVSGNINLSGTAGKVALSKNTTTITGLSDENVVDYVGFGAASEYEGSAPTPAPSNTKSVERKANDGSDPTTSDGAGKGNGWDTNENSLDFVVATPNPQNGTDPIEPEIVLPPAPPEEGVTLLKDVRANDESGQPLLVGQTVTVIGTVIVANNVVGNKTFYIQDATGGVNVYGSTEEVTVGSKVKITGKVAVYKGLTEITSPVIEPYGQNETITPTTVSVAELNNYATAEPKEGTLVTVRGKVTDVPTTSSGGGYNVTLEDGGKSTTVRVMETTGIDVANSIIAGNWYDFTGILSQYDSSSPYDSGYQIMPRSSADFVQYYALTLSHDKMTQAYTGNDIRFVADAEGADSVTVYYRTTGQTTYQSLEMTKGEGTRYTAVLAAASVTSSNFEYYIKAVNQSETKTVGSAEQPFAVSVVEDTFAPELSGYQPANNSIVETTMPTISFLVNEPSGLDQSKLSFKLDGNEMAGLAQVTEEMVTLPITSALAIGPHSVSVEVFDTKGNHNSATWTFEVAEPFTGGNHYRGTTHNHTNISHDGAGTPEDALKAGKAHGYDWFAFSDHSHDIDSAQVGSDTVDHNGMPERTGGSDWKLTQNLAKQYTNSDYVVFPAFEMTSTTWGHSNVFGTTNFIDRKMNSGKYQDLNQYYAWVITYDNIAAQFNHPDMSANAFNNFMPYDQKVDKLFTMLEVGNGSGHYGYANAESKFFSALDLGWHVAPTYGEDNHEGSWGQTLKRTVIVSKDLTQNSLLHAMENMRVYMEEDPNFKLDVLANGQYMGSVVDSQSLTFDINGSDAVAESNKIAEYNFLPSSYVSDDRIQKVELITNGGKVVQSIQPMTKDFTWKPSVTVTGGQQWFVVKVTQMDGEEIYSSPIWTKEQAVDVRVSGLEVAGDAIVSGNPATLQAGISNLGNTALSNLNVNFYYDEVNSANLIGKATVASVPAKSVGQASVTWNNPIAGNHKLIAVVDTPAGDAPSDNKFEKQVTVKQALGLTVMIDASHQNENTSTDTGTYKNNFTAFTKLIQREGYTVVENKQPITADVLKNVKVLVMTHPKNDLTAAENTAVADFVKNGGSLLLADKSNYNNNSTINNDLLQEMGATIQINNDGINDDTPEGNFWTNQSYKFAVRLHLHPVSNYITDRADTVEYYSGASLEKIGHQPLTDSNTVTILASGNESTYQGSVGSGFHVYDDVSDDHGGAAIPAIASEKVGLGRIIVSGMNFMNDKQFDESFSPKGNDELALNAVNWLADRGTVISNIADARQLEENTNVVVEGTVTTAAGVFFDAFYLQDATGGIMAFQEVPEGTLKAGDRVRVYGHIKTFENNKELEFTTFAQDVIKLGSGDPIQPKVVATGEATSAANQGLLVKVKGTVVSKFDDNSYVINDGSGDVLVFTDGYIVNQSGPVPVLKAGDQLEAVGLSGAFAQGERIRVRNTQELVGTVVADNGGGTGGDTGGDNGGGTGGDTGGNTGGNNGGNTGETPQTGTVVKVTPTITNGKAVIDTTVLAAAIEKALKENGIVSIDLGTSSEVKVEFTKEQAALLKASGIPVVVQNHEVTVEIPTSIIVDGKDFNVSINKMADISQAVSPVYEFTITIDGKEIHQFADPITLTFDVDVSKVKNTDDLEVYYYNEETKKWELVPGAVYKDGKVVVKTNHFSIFTVFEVTGNQTSVDVKAPSTQDGESLPTTATNTFNLFAAGLLLILMGSVAIVAVRRRQA